MEERDFIIEIKNVKTWRRVDSPDNASLFGLSSPAAERDEEKKK
jgi:hypothetical protein